MSDQGFFRLNGTVPDGWRLVFINTLSGLICVCTAGQAYDLDTSGWKKGWREYYWESLDGRMFRTRECPDYKLLPINNDIVDMLIRRQEMTA